MAIVVTDSHGRQAVNEYKITAAAAAVVSDSLQHSATPHAEFPFVISIYTASFSRVLVIREQLPWRNFFMSSFSLSHTASLLLFSVLLSVTSAVTYNVMLGCVSKMAVAYSTVTVFVA